MEFPKHVHVLNILANVPDAVPVEGKNYRASPLSVEATLELWDGLFSYIHENWLPPETATTEGQAAWGSFTEAQRQEIADCGAMLKMSYDELHEKLRTLPPYFLEHIFPVSVARFLLMVIGNKSLNLHHRQSTTFKEFHRRYGTMVLSS